MMKTAIFTLALVFSSLTTAKFNPEPGYVKNKHHREPTFEPLLNETEIARQTAKATSLTSNVKGHGFDRIVQIWLENQDFHKCQDDLNMQWIASQGVLLTNYYAVTHPSQPNYAASVSGDTFGMDHDSFQSFPANISTVVDLLETRHITWGEYQEHLPYAGYRGMNFSNQDTYAPDYVRKHNPLIMFDSVALNETRASNIKNFTSFYRDIEERRLPQWIFITPNMTNDAHDTNITYSAAWLRRFLEPLLQDQYFTDRTLIVLTFDENEDYQIPNRVFTVLLGGAIPPSHHGTTDPTYYNIYSTLSTVSANWDLPSLGRWDCDANIFPPVADAVGYVNTDISDLLLEYDYTRSENGILVSEDVISGGGIPYWNVSYPGPASHRRFTRGWWPGPNTMGRCASGRGVLERVREVWGEGERGSYNYTSVFPYHGGFDGLGRAAGRAWGNGTLGGVGGDGLVGVDGWRDRGFIGVSCDVVDGGGGANGSGVRGCEDGRGTGKGKGRGVDGSNKNGGGVAREVIMPGLVDELVWVGVIVVLGRWLL